MAYIAPNLTLKTVLLAKSHTVGNFDVDPVPTAAADAQLLHTEVNPVVLDLEKVDPQYILGSFTPEVSIMGRKLWTISPQIYLQGNSDVSKPPAFLPLMEACGFAVATDTGPPDNTWTLTPLSEGARPCAIYHHSAGVLAKILQCFGTLKMDFPAGQPANLTFNMKGLYQDPTDVAFPSGTLVLPTPLVRTVAKEGLTIGAYTPRFMNITLDMAGQVNERRDGNSADALYGCFLAGRGPTCVIRIEQETTLAGFNPYTPLFSIGSFTDITWTHGVAGSSRCTVTLPDWQLIDVKPSEDNKRKMWDLTYKGRGSTPDSEMEIEFAEVSA